MERLTRRLGALDSKTSLKQGENYANTLDYAKSEPCRSRNCLTTNQGCPRIASFDQRVPCNGKRGDTLSILRQVHVAAVPADGARQSTGTNDCPSRCETIRLPLCLAPERSCGTQRRSHRSTDRRS